MKVDGVVGDSHHSYAGLAYFYSSLKPPFMQLTINRFFCETEIEVLHAEEEHINFFKSTHSVTTV